VCLAGSSVRLDEDALLSRSHPNFLGVVSWVCAMLRVSSLTFLLLFVFFLHLSFVFECFLTYMFVTTILLMKYTLILKKRQRGWAGRDSVPPRQKRP
jgi:hypothetical protein